MENGVKWQEYPGSIERWQRLCQRMPVEAVREIAVEARQEGLTKYADIADLWLFLRNA